MVKPTPVSRLVNAFAEKIGELTGSRRKAERDSPMPGSQDWAYASFNWPGYPDQRLPPDCPIKPLGRQGNIVWIVDTMGQIIGFAPSERKDAQLFDLFAGHSNYVCHHWPGRNKKGEPVHDNVEMRKAWNCIVNAAERQGFFDPNEKVRERGGWAGGEKREKFIWHAGDQIYIWHDGALLLAEPGDIDGKFYVGGPQLVEPWMAEVSEEESPGHAIYAHLASWAYRRPGFDPLLLTGAIACAIYGGALEQRPVMMITADRGQGKSSLKAFVKSLLGPLLVVTDNATAMGIAQRIKKASLATWVDEFEASPHGNAKQMGIMELARQAYSGSTGLRGTTDHKGNDFTSQGAFFFSAINPPAGESADISRAGMINLLRLPHGQEPPAFPLDEKEAQRLLIARLMQNWDRFNGHLEQWRAMFRRTRGLDSRFADTFGTLLAAAHVLLGDAGMEAAGVPIAESEAAIGEWILNQTKLERSLQTENWRACLEHLLAQPIQNWDSGRKPTIGQVLRGLEAESGDELLSIEEARKRLEAAGLGLYDLRNGKTLRAQQALRRRPGWQERFEARGTLWLLAVPHDGPVLGKMFEGSKWNGGGWRTALAQAPGTVTLSGDGMPEFTKINSASKRAVFIDLAGYRAEAMQGLEDEG